MRPPPPPGAPTSGGSGGKRAHLEVVLSIKGMSCAACVGRIEGALHGQAGVGEVAVNLITQRGTVSFDALLQSPGEIALFVTSLGFPSEVVEDSDDAAVRLVLRADGPRGRKVELQRALAETRGVESVTVESLDSGGNLLGAAAPTTGTPTTGTPTTNCQIVVMLVDRSKVDVHELFEVCANVGFSAEVELNGGERLDSLSQSRDDEASEWQARFRTAASYTVPIFSLMKLFPMFGPTAEFVDFQLYPGLPLGPFLCLLLTTRVQFGVGRVFCRGPKQSLSHGTANMDVLVVLGTSTAYFYSLAVLCAQLMHPREAGHVCFEASAMLITFLCLGRTLECRAKGQTSRALEKLMGMQTRSAIVVTKSERDDGRSVEQQMEVPVELVQIGDVCKIVPGACVPVDGEVLSGSSYIDESILTGEYMPVSKSQGDSVVGGSINAEGMLLIRATRVGSDTTLAQIVRLVEDAQTSKAPVQEYADYVSSIFVPCVVTCAVLVWLGWWAAASFGWIPHEVRVC